MNDKCLQCTIPTGHTAEEALFCNFLGEQTGPLCNQCFSDLLEAGAI